MGDIDRDERKQWISDIIDALGDLHNDPQNRLGIHSVDIAFHGDLIVAFIEPDEATRLVDAGTVELTLKDGTDIALPTAPVVEQGAINHLRYLVKTRTQAGVSHLQVIQLLQAEGYNVVHTEIEAFESNLVKYNINANGMTLYLRFANVDDALNMRDIFYLDGHEVRLWHKGRFECAT
jgi:hypothetical protein